MEIHDHLHVFLLDRFQRALSGACKEVTGRLPLIEIAHDGRLLCVVPHGQACSISEQALDGFLRDLPYGLDFSTNNKLACEFVGGAASWQMCREVVKKPGKWRRFCESVRAPQAVRSRAPRRGRYLV